MEGQTGKLPYKSCFNGSFCFVLFCFVCFVLFCFVFLFWSSFIIWPANAHVPPRSARSYVYGGIVYFLMFLLVYFLTFLLDIFMCTWVVLHDWIGINIFCCNSIWATNSGENITKVLVMLCHNAIIYVVMLKYLTGAVYVVYESILFKARRIRKIRVIMIIRSINYFSRASLDSSISGQTKLQKETKCPS